MKHKLNIRTSHAKLNKFLHKKHNSLQSSTKETNLNAYSKVYTKPRIRYFSLLEAGGYKESQFWQRSQRIITLLKYKACNSKFSEFGTIGNC